MKLTNRRAFLAQTTLAASALSVATLRGEEPSKPPRIKAAQIGTRHAHAAGKIQTLRKLSELYEVVGVVEPDEHAWQQVREKEAYRGLPRLSEREVLTDYEVKVIAVETEVRQLVPTAMRCIEHGKHIHLDKPAGESLPKYEALRKASDAHHLTVQMGYMLRYNPAFEFLFRAVKAGWLGTITEVSGSMGKLASPGLRKQLAQYPGGGMFELACHLIDAVVTLLGKPVGVTAFTRTVGGEGDTFKDNQLAVLEYANALATVRCNHVDPLGFPRRSFSVAGDLGTIEINPLEPPALTLSLTQAVEGFAKGTHVVQLPKSAGRYDAEFIDLAAVVNGTKPLAWDSAHDLAAHEAILQASGLPVR